MVGKLNSDAAAATAAAAAGPKSGQALAAQIVQRARDGGAQGEPDYEEVGAAGVSSWAGSQRASAPPPLSPAACTAPARLSHHILCLPFPPVDSNRRVTLRARPS